MTRPPAIIEAQQLSKRFGGVIALRNVSFDLVPGEIHALCGENGAGKSTLIKVLGGVHVAGSYGGEVRVDGNPVAFASIRDAERAGIAVIHQELALVDEMTVAENLFLGDEPTRFGFVAHKRMRDETSRVIARLGVSLDPDVAVGSLGVGQKQLIEIAKALRKDARVLILDEPTAALSQREVERLLAMLDDLRQSGVACICISHRLEEVFALCDRVTVLRDGESVDTHATVDTDEATVIRHMVGRSVGDLYPAGVGHTGDVRLRVNNLSVTGPGALSLHDVDFCVHAGEVVGIGGLMGAGRSELLLHLFGHWGKRVAGRVELDGHPFDDPTPYAALARGMALVGEDRKHQGLVLDETVGFNLALSNLARLTRFGLLDAGRVAAANDRYVDKLRIKTSSTTTRVSTLSGGNQQKVVIGKALMTSPKVVLLDEPTRGVDIGAKAEIYALIRSLTAQGIAVLLVSSELPELLGLCDRIVMLTDGRVGGHFTREQATQETLMAAALGRSAPAVVPEPVEARP